MSRDSGRRDRDAGVGAGDEDDATSAFETQYMGPVTGRGGSHSDQSAGQQRHSRQTPPRPQPQPVLTEPPTAYQQPAYQPRADYRDQEFQPGYYSTESQIRAPRRGAGGAQRGLAMVMTVLLLVAVILAGTFFLMWRGAAAQADKPPVTVTTTATPPTVTVTTTAHRGLSSWFGSDSSTPASTLEPEAPAGGDQTNTGGDTGLLPVLPTQVPSGGEVQQWVDGLLGQLN